MAPPKFDFKKYMNKNQSKKEEVPTSSSQVVDTATF